MLQKMHCKMLRLVSYFEIKTIPKGALLEMFKMGHIYVDSSSIVIPFTYFIYKKAKL